MKCFILYVMLLELFLSGSVLSVKQPRCKRPSGKPGQTLEKSCTEKEVCTIDAKNKAQWQTCPTAASGDELKAFEADVNVNLKDLFKQHLEIIRLLHDILSPVWRKVYGLNTAGGLFYSLDDAKKKNVDDSEADLFSLLYDLQSMRNGEGTFHFKLCYPELASVTNNFFPCNEWTQRSNPFTEQTITGYAGITVTWNTNGIGGTFQGLGLSPPSYRYNLIDAAPDHANWYFSIGTLINWPSSDSDTVPGPLPSVGVKIVELSVLYTPSG